MTGEEWLEDFFQIVDSNRLERGKQLYRENNCHLEDHGEGFSATVKGSKGKVYKLYGYIPLTQQGVPNIEEMFITCSCPDWVEFCKHTVCAIIDYANKLADRQGELQDTLGLNEQVDKLKKLMTSEMISMTTIERPSFLEDNRELNEMHSIVRNKLHHLG